MLHPGFDNPVQDSQQIFRTVLAALAEPLLPRTLAVLPPATGNLRASTLAVLLTLLDQEVTLASPNLDEQAATHLRFHTGVTLSTDASRADFVLIPHGATLPDLSSLKAGEAAYPDRSATLIIEVDDFNSTEGIRAHGPGFATPRHFSAPGLDTQFWQQWQQNHARFPLGVDVLLISPSAIAGLPRTTIVEEA